MNGKSYMPIREFSRLTGIKKENLRFYDQIGLLSPELRGDNGYRYYTFKQLESAFLISDLRMLGVGIEKIKKYASERSSKNMLALFKEQEVHVKNEIERLKELLELMQLRFKMAEQALAHHEDTIFFETKAKEPIFTSPKFTNEAEEDGITNAYDYAVANGINLSSPFGVIISKESLNANDTFSIHRGYFKSVHNSNAFKPAGTYAVAYGRCHYRNTDEIYSKLLSFIKNQGYRISGNAYEEYPLDELFISEDELYGIRVEICVTKL